MPGDYDGDGESVENDLLALGYREDQFDSINLLWGHGSGLRPACSGGLTWSYGWWWDQLGRTAFTTNALFDLGDIWNPFHHEFQHAIDGMFEISGNSAYFNADDAFSGGGRFGENWNFHGVQMRLWPINDWFDLLRYWGQYRQSADADYDGVPDKNQALPINEIALGSLSTSADTDQDGYADRQESMGGQFRASNPNQGDTDGDGFLDGQDFEPLYAIQPTIRLKSHSLGDAATEWQPLVHQIVESNAPLDAAIHANWAPNFLYFMVTVDQYARIGMFIDANADGWFRGRDNYELQIDPSHLDPTAPGILYMAHVWDCSDAVRAQRGRCMWDNEPDYPFGRQVTEASIVRYTRPVGRGYQVQIAVPANPQTGLVPTAGQEIGVRFAFVHLNRDSATWASTFEVEDFVYLPLTASRRLLASSSTGGTIGGVGFADEDILAYDMDNNRWSMYFDGSDVGITDDVDAFTQLADGSLLLSLSNPVAVGGLGQVDDSDIIRFTPTRLGNVTSGSFSWYIDGSDIGLTTADEDIDAIALTADGRVLISTVGNCAVTGASGADEDLFALRATALGATTVGTWRVFFDGSDVGLTATSEDVGGAWFDADNLKLYLSTLGAFNVNNASGGGEDIFAFNRTTLGPTTSGTFEPFWRGADHGFGDELIDGFALVDNSFLAASDLATPEPFIAEPGDDLDNDVSDDFTQETIETLIYDLFLPLIQP